MKSRLREERGPGNFDFAIISWIRAKVQLLWTKPSKVSQRVCKWHLNEEKLKEVSDRMGEIGKRYDGVLVQQVIFNVPRYEAINNIIVMRKFNYQFRCFHLLFKLINVWHRSNIQIRNKFKHVNLSNETFSLDRPQTIELRHFLQLHGIMERNTNTS